MIHDETKPPQPPTPEEISRQLTEFMKTHFPGAVAFSPFGEPGARVPEPEEPREKAVEPDAGPVERLMDFRMTPREIKAHLDRFVIRQDEAKKVLSIAVCDHYNHARTQYAGGDGDAAGEAPEYAKHNILIMGPTGVGKTYLVKHIADLIGVPFVKADATKFSETGYVGGDVDVLIRDLVRKADGNAELAEFGIIYIDEVDKLATKGNAMGRDVSGRGVQSALLKLMEDTEVSLRNPMDLQGQMQAFFQPAGGKPRRESVRTRHILFIVSGAFSGLERIVSARVGSKAIGFDSGPEDRPADEDLYRQAGTADFIEYGFEAEFVGRLPVRVVCEPLAAADLLEIMECSEGSLIRQYEREFQAYGIRARFEREALEVIAERAAREKTGARGLMTVCERLLRPFKFELPGSGADEVVVNRDWVDRPEKALDGYRQAARAGSRGRVREEAERFANAFSRDHGVELEWAEDGLDALHSYCGQQGLDPLEACRQLFRDYQFGLRLVLKNTGRSRFLLDRAAVEQPDAFLSALVIQSYRGPVQASSDSA